MSKDMRKLEITFPEPIELTNDDQRVLDAVAAEICRRYERAMADMAQGEREDAHEELDRIMGWG